ncbi:MAG: Lon protease family protein [Spirochaetaceae bacterium]
MRNAKELEAEKLRWRCDEESLSFSNTRDLTESPGVIGQDRAIEAIEFGMGIDSNGFNIFAMGVSGAGRTSIVKEFVEERAGEMPVPDDWCYIFNFEEPHKPKALRLPAGKGREFRDDMEDLIEKLKGDIRKALQREDFEKERNRLMNEMQRRQSEKMTELEKSAREWGFTIQQGPQGFMITPLKEDGKPMSSQELGELSQEKRDEIQKRGQEIQNEVQEAMGSIREMESRTREQLGELERNTILFAVEHYIEDMKEKYEESERVKEYLQEVKDDVVKNARSLAIPEQQAGAQMAVQQAAGQQQQRAAAQQQSVEGRYRVNLVVDNSSTQGAPVITEMRPTYNNLIGKLERKAQMGMLYTDFSMIKPGVLHQANGGYLIMEAMHLFQYPFSYNILKHALKEGEAKLTDPMDMFQAISTESLEPEPIPLDIKVILIGNPRVYYLLQAYDEEFNELFKVKADFNSFIDRSDDSIKLYSQFLATRCQEEGWNHFDRGGAARMIEYGSELTQDQSKISTRFADICDLAREADYISRKDGAEEIRREHVQRAVDAKKRRSSRIEELIQEMIAKGDIFIDTDESVKGQVNGLAVAQLGDYSFGRPTRITARTYVGRAGVVNIDREAEMSGPIHNKGVMILSGYMNGVFGQERPISLSASLVFEQNYEGIDGDSASSTELYALLSSLAEAPMAQGIAVTGSVNQLGQIQPIGGVTKKIEGFYDVCKNLGLTGAQGVIIPAVNSKNLMLKQEVVDAVRGGNFHVYPVGTVEEGMEILTGLPFGERDAQGGFPEGSIARGVDDKLDGYAKAWSAFKSDDLKNGGEQKS